jgi:NH3-dependent NAD+ synthetase
VYLNGKKVCSTSLTNCSVPQVLGPNASIQIISNGGDSTVSNKVAADFKFNGLLLVTRFVSATNTKGSFSSVDIAKLYNVISLIKTQGYREIVISKIATSKKTELLAAERIAAIMKFINDRAGVKNLTIEIIPAASKTYFNNIYLKG